MKSVGFTSAALLLIASSEQWPWISRRLVGILVVEGFVVMPLPNRKSVPSIPTPTFSRGQTTSRLFSTTEERTTTRSSSSVTTMEEKEESLSDVDSRVLRAMLQEKKLTLDSEADVRKLLERGTVKTTVSSSQMPTSKRSNDNEEYSSQVLQTLADTKLWRKLSTRANEWAETVGIWVVNKLEQDVKVLAALGIFAWDRAVNDVARALPAVSTRPEKQRRWALTNSSSYVGPTVVDESDGARRRRNILEQMNQPVDEIQSVSREIWGILQGEGTTAAGTTTSTFVSSGTSTSQRGLRSVAPAGSNNAAERQRRAYQQQRQKTQSNSIPQQVLSSGTKMADTAYELQREWTVETNAPGYKTQPIRSAIAAGVTATTNVLKGVKDEARAIAAAKKAQRLLDSSSSSSASGTTFDSATTTSPPMDSLVNGNAAPTIDVSAERTPWKSTPDDFFFTVDDADRVRVPPVPASSTYTDESDEDDSDQEQQEASLLVLFQAERYRMVERLTRCIDDPTAAWLTPAVVESLPQNVESFFASPAMQDLLADLVLLRDDITAMMERGSNTASTTGGVDSLTRLESQLVLIRTAIQDICDCTSNKVSTVIANQLRSELLENRAGDGSVGPLSFSDVPDESIPVILQVERLTAQSGVGINATNRRARRHSSSQDAVPEVFDVIPDALFVDVIPDAFVMDTHSGMATATSGTGTSGYNEMDASSAGLMAEIVSDDDFDSAVGAAKVAFTSNDAIDEVEETKEEPNFITQVTLRSLDVMFFVVERVLIVGVPGTVGTVSTALNRVEEVNRNGQGSVGWKQLSNLADTKGRY